MGERQADLERLLARLVRRLVHNLVVLRPGEMLMRKRVKRALHRISTRRTNCARAARTHSQLIAICASGSTPSPASFGMSPTRSMYAALQPVPKMTAMRVCGFT